MRRGVSGTARVIGMALAILVPSGGAAAQCRFSFEAIRIFQSLDAREVAVADFDGDGRPDAAVATSVWSIEIWRGTGDGWFEILATLPGIYAGYLATGDFNGDGKQDIATDDGQTLLGNGDGTFQAPVQSSVYGWITAADLNADGWDDLVGIGAAALSNGDGTFAPSVPFDSSYSLPPSVGDLNGDGIPDIVVPWNWAASVGVDIGNGDGTFQPAVLYGSSGYGGVAVADYDKDGNLDVAEYANYSIAFFGGNGDGTLKPEVLSAAGALSGYITAGDIDADGAMDLTAVRLGGLGQALCPIRGLGDGTFSPPACHEIYVPSDRPVRMADVDGDGASDAVFCPEYGENFTVALGGPGARFRAAARYATQSYAPHAIAVGDLDHDGILDVVGALQFGGKLAILLGKPDGTLAPPSYITSSAIDLALADFDGDGNEDIATCDGYGYTAQIFLGFGNGIFAPLPSTPLNQGGRCIAAADLNSDGVPDFVAGAEAILVAPNGALSPPVSIDPTATPLDVALADLDADGATDVVLSMDGAVAVALGNGDGSFQPPATYADAPTGRSLTIVDLDGDGALDVVTAHWDWTTGVSVFRGNGDGTLQPFILHPAGYFPEAVAAADLDGDDNPDLLVNDNIDAPYARPTTPLAAATRATAVLAGDGTGGLRIIGWLHTGGPLGMVIGDFDRDGAPDLATGSTDFAYQFGPSLVVGRNTSLGVLPADLPNATLNSPYLAQLTASGGNAPYVFSVPSGQLPPGLTLDASGLLQGSPAGLGLYAFSVLIADANGCSRIVDRTVRVSGTGCGTLPLSPSTLPQGMVGEIYAQPLGTSGTPPFYFALASGALPPGLSLSTGGLISGVPTKAGTYASLIAVRDANNCVGSRRYEQRIASCLPMSVGPSKLPPTQVGQFYSTALAATGGVAPHTFAVTSGSLPPGLTLQPNGTLSGTPTGSGAFAFTVTATDLGGCKGSAVLTLDVACNLVRLGPAALPTAAWGQPYSALLRAAGGTAPFTYSHASGSLPPGLVLDPSSGEISGVPTEPGRFDFVAAATDAYACSASRAYRIDVVGPDYVLGRGLGQPNPNTVRTFTSAGAPTPVTFDAYAAGAWGVNVATGGIDGSVNAEILTGPGPGPALGPQARAFQPNGTPIAKVNFYAYGTLKYGVNIVASDADGDDFGEILTGAGPGAAFGPHVRAFDFDGATLRPIPGVSFYAYGTLRYGVNVGSGDVDRDGFAEILTGAGPGPAFAATVRGFDHDGSGISAIAKIDFNAFVFKYGVEVAGGDLDSDGFGEIATAPGPGPVNGSMLRGYDYDGTAVSPLPGCSVAPHTTLYGAQVGSAPISRPTAADLLCGAGRDPAAASDVRAYAYDGLGLAPLAGTPFVPFPPGYGVVVAGGNLGL